MTDRETVERTKSACSCKLGRNIRTYGLGNFDETIKRRRREGASLRDLEGVINRAILREVVEGSGVAVIGDVDHIYETLVGDDASTGERTETREQLARAGIDVDAVLEDFVSYQTVRTHLNECLGVDTDRRGQLSIDDARGTIEWARSRSEGIIDRTMDRLRRDEQFRVGTIDVSHDVRVSCTDCGGSYPIEEFLERGGCDCSIA